MVSKQVHLLWFKYLSVIVDPLCLFAMDSALYASMHVLDCWINIYFTRCHVDTYLWWSKSPNCWIFHFACFTNSSRSPLWNTSKSQERLLESLLISTLQILGNSRWCPRETAYFERALKTIRMFSHCVYPQSDWCRSI